MNQTFIVEDVFGAVNVSTDSTFILLIIVSMILLIFCCLAVSYLVFTLHATKQTLIETQLATHGTVSELQERVTNLEHPKLQDPHSDENWSVDTYCHESDSPSQSNSLSKSDDNANNDTTTSIIITRRPNTHPFPIHRNNHTKTHEFMDQCQCCLDNIDSVNININHTTAEIIYDSDNFGDECKHSHESMNGKENQSKAINTLNASRVLVQPISITRRSKYIFPINRYINTQHEHDGVAIVTNTNANTNTLNTIDTSTTDNPISNQSEVQFDSNNNYKYSRIEKCKKIHVPVKLKLADDKDEDEDENKNNGDTHDDQQGQIHLATNENADNYNHNCDQMETITPAIGQNIGNQLDVIENKSNSDESNIFPGVTNVGTILRRIMSNIDGSATCIECFTSLRAFCNTGHSSVVKPSHRMTLIYYKNGKGLKIILKAIREHITDAKVALTGMRLLNTLSKSEMKNVDSSASLDKLLQVGLIDVIIEATELHCLDKDVVTNGLTALRRLSRYLAMKKENLGELFVADKRMIRDIYQRVQKYITNRSRSNIVALGCAILANILILDRYETLKMVQHKKLITILRDVSIRFLEFEIVQHECVRCWSNVILAHQNGTNHNDNTNARCIRNNDDYKTDVINEMVKCMIPAEITFIIDQFCKKRSKSGMVVNGNSLNLIALLCISSVDENINVHLQLVKHDIGHLLKLILKSYHTAYKKDTFTSPMSHPQRQQIILTNLCCVLRNLAINSYVVDRLFGEDQNGIAFQLAKICQLHDSKLQMVGAYVDKNKYYEPKRSDIVLCMNEPFTQDVLKTLYYLRDSEWNHMIRYLWIGFHKNDQQCMISWLPKDLVRCIVRFLGNPQIRATCAFYLDTVDASCKQLM